MSAALEGRDAVGEPMRTILADPLRAMIVVLLSEASLSAGELSQRLDVSADRVRSHLRRLVAVGVVASAAEERRRGVIQRYYVSDERLDFGADFEDLDQGQRRALNSAILRLGFTEAARAHVGRSPSRTDMMLARVPVILDESGWEEMVAIQEEALERLRELRARMEENPPGSEEKTFRAVSLLIGFIEPGAAAQPNDGHTSPPD